MPHARALRQIALVAAVVDANDPREETRPRLRVRRSEAGFVRIAHRGASGQAPENTQAAFAAAIELGVDAIELDCQLSADGELVVIHDETLDRTTNGQGPVGAKKWTDLATLDAGAWLSARFKGERIPRLADVLDQVQGRVTLDIEIKSAHDIGAVEAKVAEVVRAHNANEWVLFSSFHETALRNLRAVAPSAAIGVLCNRRPLTKAIALAAELSACCVVAGRAVVDRAAVDAAHKRDLGVWVWTVNTVTEMRHLVGLGVDGICSDHPERFVDL